MKSQRSNSATRSTKVGAQTSPFSSDEEAVRPDFTRWKILSPQQKHWRWNDRRGGAACGRTWTAFDPTVFCEQSTQKGDCDLSVLWTLERWSFWSSPVMTLCFVFHSECFKLWVFCLVFFVFFYHNSLQSKGQTNIFAWSLLRYASCCPPRRLFNSAHSSGLIVILAIMFKKGKFSFMECIFLLQMCNTALWHKQEERVEATQMNSN